MRHHGSCHCGRVAFDVEGEVTGLMDCNCSICSRRGAVLWFVPRAQLELASGEDDLASYTFNKHAIAHRFCRHCGIHTFGEGTDPASGEAMAAINVRCLEDLDWSELPLQHFDGRAL